MNKTLKKNKLKIFLIFDFVMVLVFVLLFNKDTMPDKLHEVAGFVMLGMATLHLVLHPSYIVKMTKLAFSKDSKLSKKARFSYIINFLLFIILILMIVSSISISKEVFNNSGTSFMKNFHKTLAALMILIVGIHLGLHHKMIASKLKFNKIFANVLILASLIFGVYGLATTNYTQYLTAFASSSEKHVSEQELEESNDDLKNIKMSGNLLSKLDFPSVGFTILSYGSIVFVFSFATHLVEDELKRKRKDKDSNKAAKNIL